MNPYPRCLVKKLPSSFVPPLWKPIALEDDDLVFNKVFQSEWNENQDLFVSIKLTDEEAEIARKIGELSVEVSIVSLDNIDFKEDLYVSSEMTFIIKELVEKMHNLNAWPHIEAS